MEIYRVTSLEYITPELILSLINRYKVNEVPRLERLQKYYIGQSDIKNRSMNDPTKPNNRVSNPHASYIVDTVQGYFLGKPVAYASDDDMYMQKLQLIFDQNHEQAHNSKMGKQLSITGVTYELMYMNENNDIRFAMLDPEEAFMIYDNSIEMKPLCAVRFYDVHDYVTDLATTHVEVYTDKTITYHIDYEGALSLQGEQPHYFGKVPVIQYWNNDDMIGDFEKVIDLINAYDLAVSDTSNSLEYFADTYLVLTGMAGTDSADIQNMREQRVMLLDDGGKAEWLVKNNTDMEIEEFKNRLKVDIHSFSFVPDLSDQSFANAQSGEALKYKLFGLENAVAIKERNFEKGLEERVELITNILNIKGGSFVPTDVTMNFTRNIPSSLTQMADAVSKLAGIVSHETMLNMLGIDDPAAEMKKLEAEKQDTIDYNNFNAPPTNNPVNNPVNNNPVNTPVNNNINH